VHPERGMVPPLDFIPVAEASGLIEPIGAWVLQEACRQAAAWRAEPGGSDLTMSVNVSGVQVTPELPDVVQRALADSGLPPEALVLEMTESILMNPNEMLEVLGRLKALGVRLAIDDFGTGYSSLSYLHHFPIDVLKIDRSFVDRLGEGTESNEMVQAIVHLGRSLLLTTVAEGIETDEQLEALQRMGCELGQGYHLSRPTGAERITELLGALATLP
jgi:EAL domain-containing protein (putative c-di-GMP-specific phosphodiesterase class I)